VTVPALDFVLPAHLEKGEPPGRRDEVRLMVGSRSDQQIIDTTFPHLPDFLRSGDVLVINTSATLPAALDATTERGEQVVVHFSSRLPDSNWTVEVRRPQGLGTKPLPDFGGGRLSLEGGGAITTIARHPVASRLFIVTVDRAGDVLDYLDRFGRPIRYGYAAAAWPLDAYQTVYARHPGSAEMPSAGRPFTAELIANLIASGIAVLPVVLHAGVASLEEGEHPAEEYYSVPAATAAAANALRIGGGRVIAVGTTVVRALETVADETGFLSADDGYTDLVIGDGSNLRAIDGLLTGWHEPRASHLELVEAVAGRELMESMYRRAVDLGYAWHEFGDSCLLLR